MNINEYIEQVNRTLSYSDEDVFFGDAPDDLISTVTLTERLLESGEIAFGNPVFEKEIFSVFSRWVYDDKYLKIGIYARSLLENLPEDTWCDLREKLEDYAFGRWTKHEDVCRCSWPGIPEQYLKNWDWKMFEFATSIWEEKRRMYRVQRRLIFVERSA